MSAFDYTRTRATAERLLSRFGQTGALRRTTSTGDVFNPTQTTTDYPCAFAVLDYAKGLIDGTLIQQSDQMVYLSTSGLAVEPTVTDQLVVAGAPLTIISVKPLAPAGVTVYWELQVRR